MNVLDASTRHQFIPAAGSETDAVHVAGAGPAGLAAAITLRRGGRRVVVHEAQRAVGQRHRGDLQALDNWTSPHDALLALRESGIEPSFAAVPCERALAFDAWGRSYPLASNRPILYLVERGSRPGALDAALLEQARQSGAEVRFGSRVTSTDPAQVIATGPRYADAIAVGYHFETTLADGFWVILDDRVAPLGYAYLIAMRGRGTVKSCMFEDFARRRLYAERTVERFRALVGLDLKNPRWHGGVGNFRLPMSAQPDGAALVGERAGFQDAFAGFGLRYAIGSGVFAARSLLGHDAFDAAWSGAFGARIATSIVNRGIYRCLGNRGYRYLLRAQAWSGDSRAFLAWIYRASVVRRRLLRWAERSWPRESSRAMPAADDVARVPSEP